MQRERIYFTREKCSILIPNVRNIPVCNYLSRVSKKYTKILLKVLKIQLYKINFADPKLFFRTFNNISTYPLLTFDR